MSDPKRRRREREAARGGPEAGARLLVERLRAGELTRERLRVAAHLGDEAAALALGERAGPVPHLDPGADARARRRFLLVARGWLEVLTSFGAPVAVRAALACVRRLGGEVWWRRDPAPWDRALAAVEVWLADPTPERAAATGAAVRALPLAEHNPAGAGAVVTLCWAAERADPRLALRTIAQTGLAAEEAVEAVREALLAWALPT